MPHALLIEKMLNATRGLLSTGRLKVRPVFNTDSSSSDSKRKTSAKHQGEKM
jgi:hypothetical protein